MAKKNQKRFSAEMKSEIALELIKGASLEEMSRKTGRPAHELSNWKEIYHQYGILGFKSKSTSADEIFLETNSKPEDFKECYWVKSVVNKKAPFLNEANIS